MALKINNLYKSFGDIKVFNNFNIEIQENTITCILGPSGCGKTTLLNIIGNTTQANSVKLEGFNNKILSYIFQEPRLLPWKTVKENIAFIINQENLTDSKESIINKYIHFVELEDFSNYYPSQLSGGMKQRVAIARAFAYQSDVILMDEPLKALDIKLKMNLIKAFRRIWQLDKRTVIFVTHDIDEALLLGNDIYLFGKAPVAIKEKFTINTKDRDLNNKSIADIKNQILNMME